MKHILKNWFIYIFIISIIAIGSALVAEYFFDLAPCKMCLKQRYTYYAIIIFFIISYVFNHTKNIWLYIFNEIAIIYGLFYSLWHVGIEQNILPGPRSCSGTLLKTDSVQDLKAQINNQEIINCADISWSILGLSAATINSLLLIFILTINTIYILQNFYGSKKDNQKI